MTPPRPRYPFLLRVLLALMSAMVPLLLAQSLSFEMAFAGFPDGAVTEYDRARVIPDEMLIGASLLLCFWLAARSLRAGSRRDIGTIAAILVAYVVLFVGIDHAIAYYFKDVLDLDYGQGG
jgi:hypothetical protein